MLYHHTHKNRRRNLFVWVTLHAVWLIVLTIGMQYVPFTRPDEKDFLRWAAIWRHNIFHSDGKVQDSVAFIDASPDLTLIPDKSLKIDTIAPIHPPVQAITDRIKLAYLLNILHRHVKDYRYILLDISMDTPSPEDRPLDSAIRQTPNLITTALFDETENKLTPPVFKVAYAPAAYTALGGSSFYKMPVYYPNGLKSVPVVLYEKLTPNRFERKMGMVWLNGRLSFNYIIPEFYYRAANLTRSDSTGHKPANTFYLDELINMGDDAMIFLKGKYIVIGNFKEDVHNTYLGKMPGPVLLWNVFLSLKTSPPQATWSWLLFLLLSFWCISAYQLLRFDRQLQHLEKKLPQIPWLKDIVVKYVSWLGVVILINLLSTVLFNIAISTFYLATYLTGFALVIEKHRQWLTTFKSLWKKYIPWAGRSA